MLAKIGQVEIWRILEINGPFLAPDVLFPNAGGDVAERIEALSPGQICPISGRLILPIQGFLLVTPTHRILVDSCVGNDKTVPNLPDWHQRSSGRFMAALTAAGVAPDDIDYVLCTHLHTDHIGWNTRLEDRRWVPTFKNARYLMPQADEARLNADPTDSYTESVLPVIAAGQVELVDSGHKLGEEISLIETPGHTPGHVAILIQSDQVEAIITGDALHVTAQCVYPEWQFKFDLDPERAIQSRRSLLEIASEKDCRVFGSHFALPSVGRISARGGVFKWTSD